MATDVASGVASAARRDVNSGVSSPRSSAGDNRAEGDHDEDNEDAAAVERHSLLDTGPLREPDSSSATPTTEQQSKGAPLVLEKMDVDQADAIGT